MNKGSDRADELLKCPLRVGSVVLKNNSNNKYKVFSFGALPNA